MMHIYLAIIEIVCFLAFMILPFVGPKKKKKRTLVKKGRADSMASYAVNKKGYLERAIINR
ncbi:MAG: hypothetical protein AAGC65_00715 [Mucilaginibacter sp.]|uniref:hypothetical protein n=1 Tax=Mucilaginibacter sp. TaxID=1882438 RepID=UPI0031ACE0D9